MNAHSQIVATATVFDPILADAWRCNALKVEECLLCIDQYQRTMDERDEKLCTGTLVHSRANVERAEKLLPWRLSLYLEAVRSVSECEIKMTASCPSRNRPTPDSPALRVQQQRRITMPNSVQAAAEGLPKINRRTALTVTGSSLIAALAVTAAGVDKASAAALSTEPTDTELLALGEELDRELALKAELDRDAAELRPAETPPSGAAPWDDDHSKAFQAACKSSGYSAALRVAARSHRRLDRLASIQANTVPGFAVKATGLLWSMFLWEGPFARTDDAKAFRQFVAAMRNAGAVSWTTILK